VYCVCVFVWMYMQLCMRVCVHALIQRCACVSMYANMNVHARVCMYDT
jgi:hypothetical protein